MLARARLIRSAGRGRSVPRPSRAEGAALWRLGFRPLYLLASVFAALSVPPSIAPTNVDSSGLRRGYNRQRGDHTTRLQSLNVGRVCRLRAAWLSISKPLDALAFPMLILN
jgi:hypothetical protein